MKGTWTDPLTPARTATPKVGWHPGWKGCLGLSLSQRHQGAGCSGCFLAGLEAEASLGRALLAHRWGPRGQASGGSSQLGPTRTELRAAALVPEPRPSERSPECGPGRVRHSLLCARQLPCLLPAASGAGHDGGQPCFKATDVILEHSCRLPLSPGRFAVSVSGPRSSPGACPSCWAGPWCGKGSSEQSRQPEPLPPHRPRAALEREGRLHRRDSRPP